MRLSPVSAARLLPAARRVATPWKNGGGSTSEVIAWPPGADMESFLWRLSIAEVGTTGPFSHFAGIDRTLAIVSGELELAIEGNPAPVRLDARSQPFPFSGEAPVVGTPAAGPVMDLNAMVRRGRFRAEMTPLSGGESLESDGGTIVIVALAPMELSHDGRAWRLHRLRALSCPSRTLRAGRADGSDRLGYAVRFISID